MREGKKGGEKGKGKRKGKKGMEKGKGKREGKKEREKGKEKREGKKRTEKVREKGKYTASSGEVHRAPINWILQLYDPPRAFHSHII